jgi:hypothetical protein
MAEDRLYHMTLAQARKLEDGGKLLEAYEIVLNLVEGYGETDELKVLRTTLRGALSRQLQRRFADRSVRLSRLVAPQDLRKKPLRSRDALVFEKLDGVTSIDDLLAVSPLDEVDTFVALARLIDQHLVAPPRN